MSSDSSAHSLPGIPAGSNRSVEDLLVRIRSADEQVNTAAWQTAEIAGLAAIKSLTGLLEDPDFELGRRAKRALARMVHHAGRPGASREARAVETELTALLTDGSVNQRRQVVWLLSEIGSSRAVPALEKLLTHPELREDARCALMRIPSSKTVRALERALAQGDSSFAPALADALRAMGRRVASPPSRKLVPVAQTAVKAAGK